MSTPTQSNRLRLPGPKPSQLGLGPLSKPWFHNPHLATIDGLHYNFQAAGEFDLAVAPQYKMDSQVRTEPRSTTWSVITAAATTLNGHVVQFAADNSVLVDGQPVTIDNGNMLDFGDDSALAYADGQYFVIYPGMSTRPIFRFDPEGSAGAEIGLYYPAGAGGLTGLLGNANGDPSDDLALRDGTPLGSHPSDSTILGTLANSWRVTSSTWLGWSRACAVGAVAEHSDHRDLEFAEGLVEAQAAPVAFGSAVSR